MSVSLQESVPAIKVPRTPGQVADDGQWLVISESQHQPDGGYIHQCGQVVQAANVVRPVWDGLFPCSGGGRVHTQVVPYCPACENEPVHNGPPVVMESTYEL